MRHIIFIFISFVSGMTCDTTVSTKKDLLAVIRQDLRRNNDDYVEPTTLTPTSSEPVKPAITTQLLPVATKTMKTVQNIRPNIFKTNNVKTAENVKSTKKSSPFRRIFISSEILPLEDKPKHRAIKIDPSQFLMTMQQIPEGYKRQKHFTGAYKTNEMIRKNSLDQTDRKTLMQNRKLSIIWKETKATESDEKGLKIHHLVNDIKTKDDLQTQATFKPRTHATKMKTQVLKAAQSQRMNMVMNKIDPLVVTPLQEKAPITMDIPSIEEVPAPWKIPRLETTRGVIHRVALKSQDSSETPVWRAIESKETSKTANKMKNTNGIKKKDENKTQLNETEVKNVVRMKTGLRKKDNNYDLNRINELKVKLREGLKLSSLPPGDVLDLWPAKGALVNALRLKNRLCQRSVLLNEGPKYDSKGGIYMPR